MSEKIIVTFWGTFNNFVNDFTKMFFKFLLWHEHNKNTECFHDSNFYSDVFVLILFNKTGNNIWIEIINSVSVRSCFNQF